MERGQLRVEANVSLRPRGAEAFGTRVEVKNMNSFRSVERAVAFEIERQAAILDAGETLRMETRGWSDDRGETYHMRSKETSDDYRYFPEPDLPPLRVDAEWLASIRGELPELPSERRARYAQDPAYGLTPYEASVLTADPDAARLFEATLAAGRGNDGRAVAGWILGDYLRVRKAADGPVSVDPAELALLIGLAGSGTISRANAREVFDAHVESGRPVQSIVEEKGFRQISDVDALGKVVDEVLAANPDAVADVRAGKAQAVGFLVGQVMKATKGQANAAIAGAAIRERLDASEGG
jgi:aspartyl-tRNA(Asn)/glutamyl-tRNA(Gln) amidotransferase subunit B